MTSPDGAADPPWPPIVEYFAYSKSLPTGREPQEDFRKKRRPKLRGRRGRSINVDVRLRFLRLLRGRWIYDRGVALFLFSGRIRDSSFFLLTGRQQRSASENTDVFLHRWMFDG